MDKECDIIIASEANIFISSKDISNVIGKTMGADGLILTERDISPDFFNLRSGLAGEVFQKFTNYELRVALVLPDHRAYGQRFSELAYEHREHHRIRFVYSIEEALAWLCSK